ncbi:MAG: methyl-accepting chemotaxis protein [Patescibacteria group bacterium]
MRTGVFKGVSDAVDRFANMIGLTRLRVVYQLLLIIVIFMTALIVQGLMFLQFIDQTRDTAQKSFIDDYWHFYRLSDFRTNVERVNSNYLASVLGVTGVAWSIPSANAPIRVIQESITELDLPDADKANLRRWAAQLERMAMNPSRDQYNRFRETLRNIQLVIEPVFEQAGGPAADTTAASLVYSNRAWATTITIMIVCGVVSVLLAMLSAASIARPLRTVVDMADSLATGNLAIKAADTGCMETRSAVRSLNEAVAGLRSLVQAINEQADAVFVAGNELTQSSADTGQTASQVAAAMEELSMGAAEQAGQTNQVVERAKELAELVREVTRETEALAADAEVMADSAQSGRKATQSIVTEIDRVYEAAREVSSAIAMLSDASVQINTITTMIADVAEQTELLALNARIEAARAGEMGRGFDVVATQTGALAGRSMKAAESIAELTDAMEKRIKAAVDSMRQAMERIEAGRTLTADTNVTFMGIFTKLMDNRQQIERVAQRARLMAQGNEEVIEAIMSIAAISQESLTNAEDVSAAAEEQTAATEQVSALAQNLTEIATGLKNTVSAFKLGQEETG